MSDRAKKAIVGAVVCGLALVVLSAGAWGATKPGSPPPPRVPSTVTLNANNWEIWIDNRGRHTVSLPGSQPGGFWPKGTGRNYIFGGGLWVGSLNLTNPSDPDTQVTWGYNPNSGAAEFCPTTPDGDETKYLDPWAKVYLSTNPNDLQAWPEKDAQGKKVILSLQDSWTKFNDVNPIYLTAPDKPMGVEVKRVTYAWPYPGYADIVYFLFWVKNVTAKLGTPRTLTDVILGNCMDCDIGNESGANANDLLLLDNTKYQRARGDSVTRNLALQYQLAQEGGWSIGPPYFVGFRFFQSGKNNTGRTISIRSQPGIGYPEYDRDILPGEDLGMTAFQIFTLTTDPSTPGQRYLELTGRYYLNPVYNAFMYDNLGPDDKRFIQCSGPFKLDPDSVVPFVVGVMGGLDSVQVRKNSDKAQDIFDSGFLAPFPPVAPTLTAIPGDHKVTLFWDNLAEITPDPYYSQIADTTDRKKYRAYDLQGYKVYKARNVADLSDPKKRFLLGWYDAADGFTIVKDAEPIIIEYPGGRKDTLEKWDTLGTDNGLRYSFVDSGQVQGDSMGMVNGIPYFYGVTGFDFQYFLAWDTLTRRFDDTLSGNPTTLEGSASEKFVISIPRTLPQDLSVAKIDPTTWQSHGGAYNSGLKYFPSVANPDTVTKYPSSYRYEWLPIRKQFWAGTWGSAVPVYSLLIKDVTNNQYAKTMKVIPGTDTTVQGPMLVQVVDTVTLGIDTTYGTAGNLIYTPGKSVMFNGIEFGLLDTVTWTNFRSGTISVSQGSHNEPLLADTATGSTSTPRFGFKVQNWAFRGSMFKITWHKKRGTARGDSIWAEVRDSTNQVNVPPETLAVQDAAQVSGWCFGGNGTATRGKLWIDSTMVSIVGNVDTIPIPTRYPGTWLTLCGRRYWFAGKTGGFDGRPMRWAGGVCPINEGDVWIVQQQGFQVPCDGNWMQFQPTGNQTMAGGKAMLDAIKVVPNPYLVRNNWDTDKLSKHLMFTHLPTKCTIRIYTLAGDLVKTIYHDGIQNSFAAMGGITPLGGTGGTEFWNLLTYNDQLVASGMYIFHVEAPGIGNKIGKFAVIQ